jgi:hypothetical protein|tara:strand:+ start:245 stop:646 length:402 start_codon:yes stop_codon:yes gene_type:complete
MSDEGGVPADKLTKAYIKVRAQRAALSAEFKERDGELSRKLDTIKNALLDYCEGHNVESVRTSEGLFFRTSKVKYWTSDWEHMHKFIMEHNVPELLDKRLNQTNLKQFLEENPEDMPKGLNIQNEYTISVRKK